MKIIVNGDVREITARTLPSALDELGFKGTVIATAVNGEFVATAARAEVSLTEGDRLEVLAPMQGG
jgi:sulfur carrier protein